ncbi:MAG: exodeoxyribonuclease VII large subunit [Betaproteobacteria bacterium]|nr:exodeoxyribonuclease VII large subunit [Betaproteobacteria bacterium]
MPADFARDTPGSGNAVISVSQLNRMVAGLIESGLPSLWVGGEISNLTRAASGHWYFTLKDAAAQVRCVMFRHKAQAVGFQPREGDRVEARGLAGLYQPRGDFQLGVEQLRRAGAGDLHQQFLRIRDRLLAEGLLAPERKRPLPAHPRRIGVITSPQAAALRDVLAVLRDRAPHIEVILYPAPVQGADAPAALARALATAARRAECDLLLLVRGGGSIEDLWAFNDEPLARAIADCPLPVVSGVGHETDTTIADFVADLRAPTPTAAAVLATPRREDLLAALAQTAGRLGRATQRMLDTREQRLDMAAGRLRSPSAQWALRAQALEALVGRLNRAGRQALDHGERRLEHVQARLRSPDWASARQRLDAVARRLGLAAERVVASRADRLDGLAQQLELVSPRAVLARGYAILQRADGSVVRRAADVPAGEPLRAALAEGALELTVLSSSPPAPRGLR